MAKIVLIENIMKYTGNLYFFLSIFLTVLTYQAQGQKGIITYKGVINEKFVDSFLTDYEKKDRPMAVKQEVISAFKNAKTDEFILGFDNGESYYFRKEDLEENGYNMGSRAGVSPFYTNNATDMIIRISRPLGNVTHDHLEWKILNETKKIGEYICKKAITTERLYNRQDGSYDYIQTIAWFAPEIPLNFGPKFYKDLPGLILQIEAEEFTLTAIKINLNPEKEVKIIKIEDKDKVITQEESFNRIKELEADRKKRMSGNQ